MSSESLQGDMSDAQDGVDPAEAALDVAGQRRMVEAILFAAQHPLTLEELSGRMPVGADVARLLVDLQEEFSTRGFSLVERGGRWQFQTAADLSFLLQEEMDNTRRLSRAAVETLSIIAYHQPVTRTEIEELRGVSLSRGTLDVLLEAQWIRPRGRKQVPGRPVLYATTDHFLTHFGLEALEDLPGLAELRAAGLLDPVDDVLARMLEATTAQPASDDAGDEDDEGQGVTEL
ncbi:MAG: SMC-Scp complex subunit ScpB [Pseudomonadota bacterium]